jgi:hypothetical protein
MRQICPMVTDFGERLWGSGQLFRFSVEFGDFGSAGLFFICLKLHRQQMHHVKIST